MVLGALEPGACLTVVEIAAALDVTTHAVSAAMTHLVSRGLVDRKAIGCFALTDEGAAWRASGRSVSVNAPRPTALPTRKPKRLALSDRAWAALRIRQKATVFDLAELARRGEATAEARIRAYLLALERAGYVVRLARPESTRPRGKAARWLLVRDTGPLAPVVRTKRGDVWDRNTGQAFARQNVAVSVTLSGTARSEAGQ